jgi:hypothetical protein
MTDTHPIIQRIAKHLYDWREPHSTKKSSRDFILQAMLIVSLIEQDGSRIVPKGPTRKMWAACRDAQMKNEVLRAYPREMVVAEKFQAMVLCLVKT